MAKARARYIVTGKMTSNGVDLRGQRLILMGDCSWTGSTKSRDGKKLLKRELTSCRFRFEDQKWVRTMKPAQGEVVISKKHMSMFVKEVIDG